jgi:hypothetical protein
VLLGANESLQYASSKDYFSYYEILNYTSSSNLFTVDDGKAISSAPELSIGFPVIMSLDGYYIIPSFDVSIVEPKFINLLV